MRSIRFELSAWEEFSEWQRKDVKLWKKLVDLLTETARTPFKGKGKPEALKHDYKGYWSRRLTQEHRIVYKVTDNIIIVISCMGHYED